ncbi:hypothetical protein [Paraferrimonas sp. SM1919]|uniref:hypothetical protein n=1 Tax=Paraferrimonas sp. SM1919 TaxID=2662263 RepID=UPI0013D849E2|nr:hypothetical protein [Paraferrimonas sp. SM1919]
MRILKRILADEWQLLTFRRFKPDLSLFNYYLAFGIGFTWLCGIGRYWDNPRAELWQYLGLGSVAYIFIMALILWLVVMPLKPANWRYKNVLLFVSLTAPPAILYAVPVERFMSLGAAQTANVWFLAVVATWRVALLLKYLINSAKLSGTTVLVATLLPLTLIVSSLTALNLEHVVFKVMAGLTEEEKSANDTAYLILMIITYFSVMTFPFLVSIYAWIAYKRRKLK